ncbi:uncharacterized protein [Amphiura filiformis]|uniref:uncharacterized protein n=1 Tax=Amphiura filiformis TaxID=82378 RepID=UPI003B21FA21
MMELDRNRNQLIADMGNTYDPDKLKEEGFYSRTLVTLTEDQVGLILNSCIGAAVVGSNELEEPGRKRRSTSSLCPLKTPHPQTSLVMFTGGYGQLPIQWEFNEECKNNNCNACPGCKCCEVSRTVPATVLVIPQSGYITNVAIQNVKINSCTCCK